MTHGGGESIFWVCKGRVALSIKQAGGKFDLEGLKTSDECAPFWGKYAHIVDRDICQECPEYVAVHNSRLQY